MNSGGLHENLPVIFIAGATAAGKTALAMALADRYPVDLISVDAVQVYRGMDIGSAKPAAGELERYPHKLIDIRDPQDTYDAAQFRQDALGAIESAHKHGRLPVLVGGTMFYFGALEKGVSNLPKGDESFRAQLERRAAETGWDALHQELMRIDPPLAAKIQPADRQRISRALEIYALTQEPPSEVMAREVATPMPHSPLKLALYLPNRRDLHARIAQRFEAMLKAGLLAETSALIEQLGMSEDVPALRSVGYRQAVGCVRGEYDEAECLQRGVAATRQFAKRQLTWLRHQAGWVWLDAQSKCLVQHVEQFLKITA